VGRLCCRIGQTNPAKWYRMYTLSIRGRSGANYRHQNGVSGGAGCENLALFSLVPRCRFVVAKSYESTCPVGPLSTDQNRRFGAGPQSLSGGHFPFFEVPLSAHLPLQQKSSASQHTPLQQGPEQHLPLQQF
jgi:hypothetical protein